MSLNYTLPKWVENETNLVGGLDLLGLRNVAQTISNHCLNGITTISPQIRYLCLRSWFIKMYEQCNLPDNYSSFIDFSAKLEGTVAIGTVLYNPNITGVVGGTLATEIIENSDKEINIQRLVQQLVLNMYTGPSIDLGICFNRDSGITGLTRERGIPLADSVMQKSKDLKIIRKILKNKKIETFDIEELKEIGELLNIQNIPSDEIELLIDIIIPSKASPAGWHNDIRRIATYTFLLQLINDQGSIPSIENFFTIVSNQNTKFQHYLSEVINGWQCYLIRDAIAVGHEKILENVVEELKASNKLKVDRKNIIENIINNTNSLADELIEIGIINDVGEFDELRILDVYNRLKTITRKSNKSIDGISRWSNKLINESAFIEQLMSNNRSAISLLPIIWLISYFRLSNKSNNSIHSINLLSRGGWGRIGLKEVIFPTIKKWKKNNPLFTQVIAELIDRTVDQHVRIAWSRTAIDVNKDVSVMNVDANQWQYSKDFEGGRTAPRLKEAMGWLKQLQLIDDRGITSDGKDILNRGYKSLEQYYSN